MCQMKGKQSQFAVIKESLLEGGSVWRRPCERETQTNAHNTPARAKRNEHTEWFTPLYMCVCVC